MLCLKNQIPTLLILFLVSSIRSLRGEEQIYFGTGILSPELFERQKMHDPGPVMFPQGEESHNIINRHNIVTIDSIRKAPYTKYKVVGKYHKGDEVDSEVIEALAEHGARVLALSPQDLKAQGGSGHFQKKRNYAFSYKVLDHLTGDDFSHSQIRNAKITNGEYRVKLPDGRLQIVSYKADKNGYKADVKYEDVPQDHEVNIERVPVRELGSVPVRTGPPEQFHLEKLSAPIPIAVNLIDLAPDTKYLELPLAKARFQPHPRILDPSQVEIYNPGSQEYYGPEDFVSTTIATPVVRTHEPIRYTTTPVPPIPAAEIITNADHGLFIPTRNKQNADVSSTLAPIVVADDHHSLRAERKGVIVNKNGFATKVPELPEGIYIVGKASAYGK